MWQRYSDGMATADPHVEVKIDVDARAAYIRLRRANVARTERFEGSESVIVDLDAAGMLIGIEIIGLNTAIPVDRLAQSYGLSGQLIVVLKEIQQTMWQASAATGAGDKLVPATLACATI